MGSTEDFVSQVVDAYEHLYDLVYLRSHPLAEVLVPSACGHPKRQARELHDLLRDLIDELDPGPEAPPFSPEWRRHRFMVLRYLKGLTHQTIADQFGVGLRQYYRLREGIVGEIAGVLWDRRSAAHLREPADTVEAAGEQARAGRLELLRLEAARLAQAERYARIGEVARGVFALLGAVMRQRDIEAKLLLPASLPPVSIQHDLLRQALVGIAGYLVERCKQATLLLTAEVEETTLHLSLRVEPPWAASWGSQPQGQEQPPSMLHEIATLTGCHILPLYHEQLIVGYELQLLVADRTVLVVDDNEDVNQLFRRYLSPHGYRVATARTAHEALEKARQLQPYAITLDLMMPEHDGWEVLQVLTSQPETRNIPVIVCTVLKQEELALSLGAAAYLEKPVTERSLVLALTALRSG